MIPSPYVNPRTASEKVITQEEMDSIKKLLGVECLLIVADTKKHECDPNKCTGHKYSIRQNGFSQEQLLGFFVGAADRVNRGIDVPGDSSEVLPGGWVQNKTNQVLRGDGFYISYNPKTDGDSFSDILTKIVQAIGGKDFETTRGGEETALYDGACWRILSGDFRGEYLEAFPGGLKACVSVYEKNKKKHRNPWSTD